MALRRRRGRGAPTTALLRPAASAAAAMRRLRRPPRALAVSPWQACNLRWKPCISSAKRARAPDTRAVQASPLASAAAVVSDRSSSASATQRCAAASAGRSHSDSAAALSFMRALTDASNAEISESSAMVKKKEVACSVWK